MRLWVLGSGSKGNALLLECGASRILIDAGFPAGSLGKRLRSIGVAPESLEGVIITHEHSDHVRGAAGGVKRWGWRVHATTGTLAACPGLADAAARGFRAGSTLTFCDVEVHTVLTSHDAEEPVALVATARESGVRAGIAYDLGCGTPAIRRELRELDLLVLESNHDGGMLRTGPYPWMLKRRIASSTGHLSNRAAGELVRDAAHRGLREVVLAHLSEINNTPEIARAEVADCLRRSPFRGRLSAAPQRGIVGPFGPGGARPTGEQLSFSL
ncbi:MAG TPA: MBL fold metallo-hydrolase [Gemmatimonadaceae bacterium]|nr:MBL fold metallo-hydrolase [Gemmatimonadaceae bacterium]